MCHNVSMERISLIGLAGVGKTVAWRLIARQVLGLGWQSTAHVIQARDLAVMSGAMKSFEDFLKIIDSAINNRIKNLKINWNIVSEIRRIIGFSRKEKDIFIFNFHIFIYFNK